MNQEPLISSEVFDYLRNLSIEPYTKLSDSAREQLGDGVRLISLFAGESFVTHHPGLRISVISGQVLLQPGDVALDLAATREHTLLTQDCETRLLAREDSVVLLADVQFLDLLSSWTELAAYASQSETPDLVRRLRAIRHTCSFQRLPLEHVMHALKLMQPRQVKHGEVIVTQGERGDAFYLIWSGHAEVWQTDIYDDAPRLITTIGPRDAFGDEALVIGGNRNATVKMVEDGELLVLNAEDFRNLMAQPLIREITQDDVASMLASDWKAVDVRYAEEFEDGHIPAAIHLPLPELRARADSMLDKSTRYITVCLSGKRSTVAAFLLKQRGYEVVTMKGGMSAWQGEVAA